MASLIADDERSACCRPHMSVRSLAQATNRDAPGSGVRLVEALTQSSDRVDMFQVDETGLPV